MKNKHFEVIAYDPSAQLQLSTNIMRRVPSNMVAYSQTTQGIRSHETQKNQTMLCTVDSSEKPASTS